LDTTYLEDPMVQDIAKTAVADFGKALGADEQALNYVLNEATPEEQLALAQRAVDGFQQGLAEGLGEEWAGLLGSFFV